MHLQRCFIALPLIASSVPIAAGAPHNFRIITHNLRYARSTPQYNGEHVWGERLPGQLKELNMFTRFQPNSFVSLQECLHTQLKDLIQGLNMGSPFKVVKSFNHNGSRVDEFGRLEFDRKKDGEMPFDPSQEWSYIGVGRDDGIQKGEYSPLLYRPKVWRLETWHSMWMSDTPNEPSPSFGTVHHRILTQGVFTLRSDTSVQVAVMSTHLDDNYYDENDEPRFKSTKLLTAVFDRYSGRARGSKYSIPVALGGDFNGNRTDPAMINMHNGTANMDAFEETIAISPNLWWGEDRTYTSFGGEWRQDNIDYVWGTPYISADGTLHGVPRGSPGYGSVQRYWRPAGYGCSPTAFKDFGNLQNSDHRLVFADLVLESKR